MSSLPRSVEPLLWLQRCEKGRKYFRQLSVLLSQLTRPCEICPYQLSPAHPLFCSVPLMLTSSPYPKQASFPVSASLPLLIPRLALHSRVSLRGHSLKAWFGPGHSHSSQCLLVRPELTGWRPSLFCSLRCILVQLSTALAELVPPK